MNTDKDFVPYQPSLDMKEIGFDKPCLAFFTWKNELKPIKQLEDVFNSLKNSKVNTTYCSSVAPTFSQAFRWFRERYNLKSWIQEHTADTFIYEIRPHKLTDYKEGEVYVYNIHEEAELACLKKLIEIVKSK